LSSGPVAPSGTAPTPARGSVQRQELERRRERIARELAEEQWDLGGLAYEMAIRDHFRLDVLTRKAAHLQELDAELAAIERLIKMESEGAAGACRECGALYARGAIFCWQCGVQLTETRPA
jgi:transposase